MNYLKPVDNPFDKRLNFREYIFCDYLLKNYLIKEFEPVSFYNRCETDGISINDIMQFNFDEIFYIGNLLYSNSSLDETSKIIFTIPDFYSKILSVKKPFELILDTRTIEQIQTFPNRLFENLGFVCFNDIATINSVSNISFQGYKVKFDKKLTADWYLPSLGELQEIHDNLYNITSPIGGFGANNYWSSSQDGEYGAINFNFQFNSQNTTEKDGVLYIRPIRQFTSTNNYTIGSFGQFGWVFYKEGNKYYECATLDYEVEKDWGTYGVDVVGTGTAIGDGANNTALIIEALEAIPETDKAAQYCNNLIVYL